MSHNETSGVKWLDIAHNHKKIGAFVLPNVAIEILPHFQKLYQKNYMNDYPLYLTKHSHVKIFLDDLIVWISYNACNLYTLSRPPHTYVMGMRMKFKVQTPCILGLKHTYVIQFDFLCSPSSLIIFMSSRFYYFAKLWWNINKTILKIELPMIKL